jgi:protein gp37
LFNKISKGEYNNLIFLFLTKRPENIAVNVPTSWITNAPKNVWFGTSISNQETANIYRNRLVSYKGNNLFLSIEPQVGDIWAIDLTYIGWVIQGGESGHNKREFQLQWAYDMKRMCKEQNTPYFFKQIDKIQAIPNDLQIREFPLMHVGSACL